ncbi:MAG TPA: prepilin peptidase [Ilumatobacteraceae bacterium]|nr:prepilin peptidase [Ilumatobacteraceae bacterium]
MGVPLIPDRAASRSQPTRSFDARANVLAAQRLGVLGVAALSVAALAVAAAVGAVPLAGAVAVALLVPAAVVDVAERRLPDVWLVAALGALIVLLTADLAFGASTLTDPAFGGIVGGGAAMALPVLALHLLSPASMGFGDVKAAAVLGAAAGTVDWRLGAVALCLASLGGAAVGVLTRRRTIAFGPFLVFGAWLTLLAHEWLADVVLSGGVTP